MTHTLIHTIYLVSGLIIVPFIILIAKIVRTERSELLKARMFLNYGMFRWAFFILAGGAVISGITNIYMFISDMEMVHSIGEMVFHTAFFVFSLLLFIILRKGN